MAADNTRFDGGLATRSTAATGDSGSAQQQPHHKMGAPSATGGQVDAYEVEDFTLYMN